MGRCDIFNRLSCTMCMCYVRNVLTDTQDTQPIENKRKLDILLYAETTNYCIRRIITIPKIYVFIHAHNNMGFGNNSNNKFYCYQL